MKLSCDLSDVPSLEASACEKACMRKWYIRAFLDTINFIWFLRFFDESNNYSQSPIWQDPKFQFSLKREEVLPWFLSLLPFDIFLNLPVHKKRCIMAAQQ